jgi:hypothetical protein
MSETTIPWTHLLAAALRGENDLLSQLREGRKLPTVLWHSLLASFVGAAVFGVALGSYGGSPAQIRASAIKATAKGANGGGEAGSRPANNLGGRRLARAHLVWTPGERHQVLL